MLIDPQKRSLGRAGASMGKAKAGSQEEEGAMSEKHWSLFVYQPFIQVYK